MGRRRSILHPTQNGINMAEDFTIPIGKFDWVWAVHDRPAGPENGKAPLPALVVMVHGFPGDSQSYGNIFGQLSDVFVRDGFHTLRFDMRGCGRSHKGAKFYTLRAAHEDTLAVLRWAVKQGYTKIVMAAEGYGATVALTALIDTIRPSVRGLLLLWPLLERRQSWLSGLIAPAEEAEKAGHDYIEIGQTKIGLNFIREVRDYNLLPLMRRMSMPIQIHHGTADNHAPLPALRAVLGAAGINHAEIIPYEGGHHGLKTDDFARAIIAQSRVFMQSVR